MLFPPSSRVYAVSISVLTLPTRGYISFIYIMEALGDRFLINKCCFILQFTGYDSSGLGMQADL